jgi:hypothetical protein
MASQTAALSSPICDLCKSIFEGRWEPAGVQRKAMYNGRPAPDKPFCDDDTLVKVSDCLKPNGTHMMSSLHHSLASLKRSAKECVVCAKIWDQLQFKKDLPFDLNHPPKDMMGHFSFEPSFQSIMIQYISHATRERVHPTFCAFLRVKYNTGKR